MKTIIGLFDDHEEAVAAIRELRERRIPPHDISLVANNADGWYADDSMPEARAETGASVGAVVGAVGGLLAGLGMVTIPGIGPVVSAGWLLSTIAGSATGVILGGAAGSLIGALQAHGIDDPDAQVYAEGLRRGGSLVIARVEEKFVTAAETIMIKHRVDVAARRDELAAEGWTRFDDSAGAQPYLSPAKRSDPLHANSPID
jgi:uncharacterized membrane protein